LFFNPIKLEIAMASNRNKKQSSRTPLKEFVTVAFAEDMDLAKDYKKLLNDESIPVAIKNQSNDAGFLGIAVMVPEDHLDEAHILIESRGACNDFYDMVFGQTDFEDEDFDEDIFREDY
jgi:hypothetical protein